VPSWLAHAPAALGAAVVVAPSTATRRFWVTAALCGIIPDVDFLGAPFGSQAYSDFFGGHRGVTHGVPFAVALGVAFAWLVFRDPRWNGARARLAVAFTLAMVTHGILDAMTDLGPPIAFLSPFSSERYTFPWHPIHPSGVSHGRGFAGLPAVFVNEFVWGGLPGLVLLWSATIWRRRRSGSLGSAAA
jgi:inner membrane protein